jgi:hypothetical protein
MEAEPEHESLAGFGCQGLGRRSFHEELGGRGGRDSVTTLDEREERGD